MMTFHRESAEKFIATCQYLKGKEVTVRTIGGSVTKGIVRSIGAFSWYPKNFKSPIELYANIEINKKRVIKVALYDLYKALPAAREQKFPTQSEPPQIGEQL